MSLADDFVKQAGGVPAAPASAPSLAAQFMAQAQPTTADASTQTPWYQRAGGELARQLGLTARAGITGLTGLPAIVGNGVNGAINLGIDGVNSVADSNIPHLQMPTAVIQNALDAAGLPQPKNATERVVQDATGGMAGVGGTYKLGQSLMNASAPVAKAVGQTLTALPGNQVVSAASAGAAGEGAQEAGLNPAWQLGASLLGGVGGALGAGTVGSMLKTGKNVFFPEPGNTNNAAPAVQSVTGESPLPPSAEHAQTLADKTTANIANNPGADPQAAARLAEFQSLGMSPTLGQVTRDPGLFAQEQNWRGVSAGRPLLQKFNSQNQQLAQALKATAGSGATEYADSNTMMGALNDFDASLRSQIKQAYAAAKASTGKDLDVPMQGMAQDYAQVLKDFGKAVPDGVRKNFNSYGLGPNGKGMQTKVFTIDDAENLLKVINQNQGADPVANTALKQLSESIKSAVLSADDQGGVYAVPRQMAAARFSLLDSVPAFKAAVRGTTPPDTFASKFIINGNADDVAGLADILQGADPKAYKALQGQVGNKLQQSAFGQNLAGDKVFSPERYATVLRQQLGPDVLRSVYTPEQLNDLNTIGRVGAYINSEPAFSPVNRSNTGSAVLDMLSEVPLVGKGLSAVSKGAMISRALKGDIGGTGLMVPADQSRQMGVNAMVNALRTQPLQTP
jgi:hypothetical protein